ncbi:hypothetical protein H0H81_000662 [Sphagnurus paluster]|uniref:Uncharacterized protein n=1 Tax=Sphagnurus paluster TaxID=117069 RepID=A0A9P7G2B5_9AGAR|nr:hypothetical protein H0H81_000662 [Sphagnurus paluster]
MRKLAHPHYSPLSAFLATCLSIAVVPIIVALTPLLFGLPPAQCTFPTSHLALAKRDFACRPFVVAFGRPLGVGIIVVIMIKQVIKEVLHDQPSKTAFVRSPSMTAPTPAPCPSISEFSGILASCPNPLPSLDSATSSSIVPPSTAEVAIHQDLCSTLASPSSTVSSETDKAVCSPSTLPLSRASPVAHYTWHYLHQLRVAERAADRLRYKYRVMDVYRMHQASAARRDSAVVSLKAAEIIDTNQITTEDPGSAVLAEVSSLEEEGVDTSQVAPQEPSLGKLEERCDASLAFGEAFFVAIKKCWSEDVYGASDLPHDADIGQIALEELRDIALKTRRSGDPYEAGLTVNKNPAPCDSSDDDASRKAKRLLANQKRRMRRKVLHSHLAETYGCDDAEVSESVWF